MNKEKSSTTQAGGTADSKDILTKSPVSLHSSQAEVMSVFKQHKNKYIHTFIFRDHGVANPAQRISELKIKGALINTRYAPAEDSAGKEHQKVAWYLFKGWEA